MDLRFEEPVDGAVFTAEDDIDDATAGVQILVKVHTEGLKDDDVISVVQNDNGLGEKMAEETVEYVATLTAGTNVFQIAYDGDLLERIEVELDDPCGEVSFVAPAPPEDGEDLVLGGDDDFCAGDQTVDFEVAAPDVPDGTPLMLVVNGNVAATTEADGGEATFEDVSLGGRRESGNEVFVRIGGDSGGEGCGLVAYPANIIVDCDGPECVISSPQADGVLDSTFDADSETPGLQLPVEVTTDASASGQPVRLVVDAADDEALEAIAGEAGRGVKAHFPSVTLASGMRDVSVTCSDAEGNSTTVDVTWTVDVEACTVEITSLMPEPEDGVLTAASGGGSLDVSMAVNVMGDDCEELRAVVASDDTCSGIDGAEPMELTPGEEGEQTVELELSEAGEVHLCAQVKDVNGNVGLDSVPVTFENGAPSLRLSLHPDNAGRPAYFNRAGTTDADNNERIADAEPATEPCDAAMVVACLGPNGELLDDVDVAVQVKDASEPLVTGTCQNGEVVFEGDDLVPLPSQEDEYELVATATVGGMDAISPPLAIRADCVQPALGFWDPDSTPDGVLECGSTLRPDDDETTLDVVVENPDDPRLEVSLWLHDADDPNNPIPMSPIAQSDAIYDGDPDLTVLEDVDLTEGGNGDMQLIACVKDAAGNETCIDDCYVTVGNVPKVTITTPAAGAVLFPPDLGDPREGLMSTDSCSGPGTYNIEVTATVEAVGGGDLPETVAVQVGSQEPVQVEVGTDGSVETCAAADVSGAEVDVTVTVDGGGEGSHTARVAVVVDTIAPAALEGLATVEAMECRAQASLTWDVPNPADATLAGYELRCVPASDLAAAEDPAMLTPEEVWEHTRARTFVVAAEQTRLTPPGLATTAYCTGRAFDVAMYSPLSDTAEDVVAYMPEVFPQWILDLPDFPDTRLGAGVTGVGDVNGDGLDDFVVAGGGLQVRRAFLYFGQPMSGGAAPTPIAFGGPDGSDFGLKVRPLGNFDDDAEGTDDFLINAPGAGMAYVILGRTDPDAWPTGVHMLDAGGCSADLCLATGTAVSGNPRTALAVGSAGTFNTGDSIPDLAVGTWGLRVVVVLGSGDFAPTDMSGTGNGACLDLRGPDVDDSVFALGCAPATASVPDGFRISLPDGDPALRPFELFPRGVTAARGGLWFHNSGAFSSNGTLSDGEGATLMGVQARSHSGAGLDEVAATEVEVVDTPDGMVGFGFNQLANDLVPVGDFDGDGVEDLMLVSVNSSKVRVVYGARGDWTTFDLGRSLMIDGSSSNGTLGDQYGNYAAPGVVPGSALAPDLDGDGRAELVIPSGLPNPGEVAGAVDVVWGSDGYPRDGSALLRNGTELHVAHLNAASLGAPDPEPDPYARGGAHVGDVDGDGVPDVVLVETGYNPGDPGMPLGTPRIVVLGMCQ